MHSRLVKPRICAVMFDLVGTLATKIGSPTYERVFKSIGVSVAPEVIADAFQRLEHCYPCTSPDTNEAVLRVRLAKICHILGVPDESCDAVAEALRAVDRAPLEVRAHVPMVLDELRHMGLRLGVCSNGPSNLNNRLDHLGIGRFFDAAVSSTDYGTRKPDPGIFRFVCACLDVDPSQTVHIGDSPEEDVAGALAAGLGALLIADTEVLPDWLAGLPNAVRVIKPAEITNIPTILRWSSGNDYRD